MCDAVSFDLSVTLLNCDAVGGCDDSDDLDVTTLLWLSGGAACVDWAKTLLARISADVVPTKVVVDFLELVDKVWLGLVCRCNSRRENRVFIIY